VGVKVKMLLMAAGLRDIGRPEDVLFIFKTPIFSPSLQAHDKYTLFFDYKHPVIGFIIFVLNIFKLLKTGKWAFKDVRPPVDKSKC
jgi:hypothetical protein